MTYSLTVTLVLTVILLAAALAGVITMQPRNMAGAGLHWFLSWLAQCFSPQLALISLVLALWLGLAGQMNVTRAVIALAGFACSGLYLLIWWRGLRTGPVVDGVVDAAIARITGEPMPAQYSSGSHPDANPVPGSSTAVQGSTGEQLPHISRLGLRPFHFGSDRVRRIRNVPYGEMGMAHLLDIYLPVDGAPGPMPILIQVPGGAWVTGSKNEQGLPLLNRMAAMGWACFAINYRLGPKARFPDMLTDVLMAIAWVKANAANYGADPGFVAITGGSAGGHLASLVALLAGDRARFQPGFEQADTSVSVAVPVYGRYDFLNRHGILPDSGIIPFLAAKVMPGTPDSCPELWQQASPEAQVHSDAPPFLIVHGSGDTLIPVEEARAFCGALKAVSKQAVDYVELPGAQHAFDMVCSSWSVPTVLAISRYLNARHRHYRRLPTPLTKSP